VFAGKKCIIVLNRFIGMESAYCAKAFYSMQETYPGKLSFLVNAADGDGINTFTDALNEIRSK